MSTPLMPVNNPFAPDPLVHLSDQSIDLVLPVTQVTTFNIMFELSRTETASGVAKLEWPKEVGSLLEVGADGEDLMDQILHANNAVFSKVSLNKSVISESNALLVNLAITTLVDELSDGLEIGVSIGNPGLDNLEHLEGGLCQADEDTIVDLEEAEELKDLARFRRNLVDTVMVNKRLRNKDGGSYPLMRTTKTSLSSAGT